MKKRLTRDEKLAVEKAALYQRVADIAAGASMGESSSDDEHFFATADFLSRFIPALKVEFLCEANGKSNKFAFEPHCLAHFENVEKTVDHLFNIGVRA